MVDAKNGGVQDKNPNEIVFSKTKGLGSMNYGRVVTTVVAGETSLSVERRGKVLFFKGKPKTVAVDYQSIEKAEVKTHFSKGDLASGLVLGALAIIFAATGAFGEEGPGILAGPIIIAVMVFCAWGKNIVITRKDATTVNILGEGIGQGDEIKALCKKLEEKGVAVQRGKELKSGGSAVSVVIVALACSLALAGCGRSTEDLAKEVRASIEETWDEQGIDITIKEFTLIKKNAAEYRGILKAFSDGETEDLTVNVTVDGDSFMWELE